MDQQKPKLKKPKRDPLRNLKYLGYKISQLPEKYTLKQFVDFAKFQLAKKTRRLLKDPIWDDYTVEELLVEFYAHQFEENKEFRIAFEQEIGALAEDVDDFNAWADKQMAKERAKTLGATEDKVSFSPNDVMGEE